MENLEFTKIKFPQMREELIQYLEGLSDKEYQKNCWVEKICPDNIQNDELDYVVHFLFDDTELFNNPQSLIGYFLKNEKEALLVKNLCRKLISLFDKYGYNRKDSYYINLSDWDEVIISAKNTLDEISKN